MLNLVLSIIAGGLAGLASSFILARRRPATAPAPEIPEPPTAPEPVAETVVPVAAEEPAEPAEPEAPAEPPSLPALLTALGKTLFPLAEAVDHPRELTDMAEFQAVVAALRRPDASLALLQRHALGGNWPLAAAAFVVLAERPDRQVPCEAVVRHMPATRPYVLLYLLRYLTVLAERPPIGEVVLAAPQWWQNNAVIPGFIEDYFARSAMLGDRPLPGRSLASKSEDDLAHAFGLLQKIQHPFAGALTASMREWLGTRIDREFLSTVGALWGEADADPLLVAPAAWQEHLVTAQAAIGLTRPRSVLVTGDPRIGKTAFVKLLAEQLEQDGWTIFAAGGTDLQADQSYIGQLEGRIRKLIELLHARRKLIWYIRDFGQLAESGTHKGQSATMLDQILPAMASGQLIVIGESSQAAAARLFRGRSTLRSVMEVVPLEPMDEAQTVALAVEVAFRLADQGGPEVPKQTVGAIMDLAQHYLGSGHLPGTVLDLLKRAAARSISAGETSLTAESVVQTLAQLSGLPAVILDTSQRADLAEMRGFFTKRVMGQDEAVRAVVDRIAMLKAGLTDPGKPTGVFLFAGPTGTGKTELAKTLAEFLFGSADRMTRLDMSEFQTVEATSKILGQRGEIGGDSLIDRIRKQPFAVVLLDEFEKAHSNCWDLFLQIFDDGRLSDANGLEADFRHCIIILTSNLGATTHRGGGMGFSPDTNGFTEEQVLRTIGQTFRPEFINRLDKVIVFQPLSRELMRGILRKELAGILERRGLRERAWAVEWEASAIEFLLDRGFSPEMGARPLKRAIDQQLLAPLAATLVEHRFPQGDQFLFVRSDGKGIQVEFVDPDAEPAGSAPIAEPEAEGSLSLPAIILSPTGSASERSSLAAAWRELDVTLAGEAWSTRLDRLRLALADPSIWSSAERHRVFSGLELADRIEEAARTADRLFQRYMAASAKTDRASRELAGRLALQLHNLRQGMADLTEAAPVDALLRVEPALETGDEAAAWCARLLGMYRHWGEKRRMQVTALGPILSVTGFGAFRTLKPESGLHVLERGPAGDGAQRIIARVTVLAGPDQALPEATAQAEAARLLDAAAKPGNIIRRYRAEPAPIVRDIAAGWRSGRLDAVLSGDFDLIGAMKAGEAAPERS